VVYSISLDAALDLLWLGIALSAILGFGRLNGRRSLIVFLATVALFPVVSDSDDLLNLSFLRIPAPHHRSAGTAPEDPRETDSIHLARLFESLDHWQPAAAFGFAAALCFVAILIALQCTLCTRAVLASAGRAPPAA